MDAVGDAKPGGCVPDRASDRRAAIFQRVGFEHQMVVARRARRRGRPAQWLDPRDLARVPLLHVLGYEEGWGYWLERVGADQVDSSSGLQFDTLVSTLRMAELGLGVALARSSLVEDLLPAKRDIVGAAVEHDAGGLLAARQWRRRRPHPQGDGRCLTAAAPSSSASRA